LTNDEVARLLLDPFALYDLSDLINTFLTDWWIGPLAAAGRDISCRYGMEIGLPDVKKRRRKSGQLVGARDRGPRLQGQGYSEPLEIVFADESLPLKRRIAECLYGSADRDFTLTLHRRKVGESGNCVAELEVSPAPVKQALMLTVEVKGHARTFTLMVPPSARRRVFARADAPLPEEAFQLQSQAEWRDDTWPPHLILC
jgi:hypothetical protein